MAENATINAPAAPPHPKRKESNMTDTVTLTLDRVSANDILTVLGQLPTSSGAWPLMMSIKQQIDATAPEVEAPAAAGPAA